jgi:hypothetical protein
MLNNNNKNNPEKSGGGFGILIFFGIIGLAALILKIMEWVK